MPTESFSKMFLSAENTLKARTLKSRTGLTPNILCRFGIVLSTKEQGAANPADFDSDGQEFNRYTLFGAHEPMIIALVKQRCYKDGLDPEMELAEQIRAHANRGIGLLYPRLKSIVDIGTLVEATQSGDNVQLGAL